MFEFKLPDLGEGIHEGEILKWYAAAGETIGEDEPLIDGLVAGVVDFIAKFEGRSRLIVGALASIHAVVDDSVAIIIFGVAHLGGILGGGTVGIGRAGGQVAHRRADYRALAAFADTVA